MYFVSTYDFSPDGREAVQDRELAGLFVQRLSYDWLYNALSNHFARRWTGRDGDRTDATVVAKEDWSAHSGVLGGGVV